MPGAPRASVVGGWREVPEVAMDYCPVLRKGRLRGDTIERAAGSIRRLGHRGRVLLKTDNEPALVDLKQGMADALAHSCLLYTSDAADDM
eukprot:14553588-Alexandrium_andersonii.AAC.1